jgi:hypothetical protein
MRLTNATEIAALTVPEHQTEKIFWDDKLRGFGLRLRATGSRTWIVRYKIASHQRAVKIGSAAVFNPVQARAEAKKILAAVALGRDPAAEWRNAPLHNLEQRIANKALAFLGQNLAPACYLYRHYHPNGDLLYVGISLDPLARQDRHTKHASWRNMICRILIEPFATREEALTAEQLAIRAEFPKFNAVHNGQRQPIEELGRIATSGVPTPILGKIPD